MLDEIRSDQIQVNLGASSGELFGRAEELAYLSALVERTPVLGASVVILGFRGAGKSTLLREMVNHANQSGLRVLGACGRECEVDLEGATLFELLRPILDDFSEFAGNKHAKAVLRDLNTGDFGRNDLISLGGSVLSLVRQVASRAPVLLFVDDSQWMDKKSRDVLAFVSHRLGSDPVVIAFATEAPSREKHFEHHLPQLRLGPLSRSDASRILDSLPEQLRGRARFEVLESAGGNPLALAEFSRAVSERNNSGGEPLCSSNLLSEYDTQRCSELPPLNDALIALAAAEESDRVAVSKFLREKKSSGIELAERLGIVHSDRTGSRFCSPLLRSAVYHRATLSQRLQAHGRLAELCDRPDRRAWHLSAAQMAPQDEVADLLESTAGIASSEDGPFVAARSLERAAELTSDPELVSRRLVMSAEMALRAGEDEWASELANRALELAGNSEVRLLARRCIGAAELQACEYSRAASTLSSLAADAVQNRDDLATDALALATTAQFESGIDRDRDEVIRALEAQSGSGSPTIPNDVVVSRMLWVRTGLSSITSRNDAIQCLRRLNDRPLDNRSIVPMALTAWVLDEPELAIELCRNTWRNRSGATHEWIDPSLAGVLAWSYVDTGRWCDALEIMTDVTDHYAPGDATATSVASDLINATIEAMRGDVASARIRAERVLKISDPFEARSTEARARHALGLAAVAEKNYLVAFDHFKKLFGKDGEPLHRRWSYLAIGDMAHSARHAGCHEEVSAMAEMAITKMEGQSSPRLEQAVRRARALFAESDSAEVYFEKGLTDQEGLQWPFERAQFILDYAQWLRRQRRINEAKIQLIDALDRFHRLGAAPWEEQARAELRACGSAVSRRTDGLRELTSQETEIVRLASKGLTNREIGVKLFISARTVGSHLYHSFPKLGVSSRQQLRDFAELFDEDPTKSKSGSVDEIQPS